MLIARIGDRTSPVTGELMLNGVKKYITVDFGMVDEDEVRDIEVTTTSTDVGVAVPLTEEAVESVEEAFVKPVKKKGRPKKDAQGA